MDVSSTPRKVSREDIAAATHIISMGCDLNDLPLQGESVERWDEVPPVSQDLEKAWLVIKKNVETLVEQVSTSAV